VTAAALFQMLKPNYAWAVQVPADDKRINAEYISVASPKRNGSIKGYGLIPTAQWRITRWCSRAWRG
jgi:carboxymethylenebutenolidase